MENNAYDLVISGGGVAGATLATLMARSGSRVLVLEREQRFRDRVRGEWLAPWGVAEARKLSLAHVLQQAGARELQAQVGRSGRPRPVATPSGDLPMTFYHPALQEALLSEAALAGATVIRGARVTAVGDTPTGHVRYTSEGNEHLAWGRIIVGADGRSSLVRQAVGGTVVTHRHPRMLAGVRLSGVSGDPSVGYFVINESASGNTSLFPQGDGFARAYVFTADADASSYAGPDGFKRFIQSAIALGIPSEVLANAQPAGPLAAFVTDDSWVEHPARGRLALIGDAAGMTDPTWGMGIALALRDARALAEALQQGTGDWEAAVNAYARQRARYFQAVVTAENWQSELQLTPGKAAFNRRRHAMRLWSREPDRVLDLEGLGPDVDVSPEARTRFFGDDVPIQDEHAGAPSFPEPSRTESLVTGHALLDAIKQRDFAALRQYLAPSVRMRALIPSGAFESRGDADTVALFAEWFGDVVSFQVESASAELIADCLSLRLRSVVRWHGEAYDRVVDQHMYVAMDNNQITMIDLLCSGFRPLVAPGHVRETDRLERQLLASRTVSANERELVA